MVGIAVVIVVVLVVGVVGIFALSDQGILDLDFQLGSIIEGGGFIGTMIADLETTPPLLGIQNYDGNLAMTFDAKDSLDPTISYDQQFFSISCFERITDDVTKWEVIHKSGNSANEQFTFEVRKTTSDDAGLTELWCQITNQNFNTLIDIDGIIRANSKIDMCIYEVISTGDQVFKFKPSWICRINLIDISVTDPNVTPSLQTRIKLIKEEAVLNLDQTLTIPLNIGTGEKENRIKFFAEFSADQKVKALSQIQITVQPDCGDGASACPKIPVTELEERYDINSFIEVPLGNGIQKILLSDMERTELTSRIIYKWKYDQITGVRDVASANFILIERTEDTVVDFPLFFQTRFTNFDQGSENTLCIELKLTYVNDQNEFESTSNDIELVASTVNDNGECVIT